MLLKTNAIVLSKLKYRDNDLIVKCYTNQRGVVSYLLRGVLKSKKGSSQTAYFQPLSQLQLEENYRANQSLQFINDVRLDVVYRSLHTDIFKSAIVMFISEVLSSVLKEEEKNEALYGYLQTSFIRLDAEVDSANFHLLFLLNLTKYLGFYPDESNLELPYFNLSTGAFELNRKDFYSIFGENSTILKQLLGMTFEGLNALKLNSKQRQSFLTMLLLYYELHLGDFRKPKSLSVFNQVFS
ncbi:MAG: DNA repair protein RecO [Aquaticitalea sp.]